mmetsp:Transcript_87673/g.165320  ORF Transcript_87673/g.165320 Transcript_87673/m.165320 type:complete len:165 (-) Transcript_87673:91-585(-)
MRSFALVLACFACTGYARNVRFTEAEAVDVLNKMRDPQALMEMMSNPEQKERVKMMMSDVGFQIEAERTINEAMVLDAMKDPEMLAQIWQDPKNKAIIQKLMASPKFVEKAKRTMEQSIEETVTKPLEPLTNLYEQQAIEEKMAEKQNALASLLLSAQASEATN